MVWGTCSVDVALAFDGSASITSSSWSSVKQFGESLAKKLNVSQDGAHLGCVQFSSQAQVMFDLTGDQASAVEDLANMQQLNGGTAIGRGLQAAGDLKNWRTGTEMRHILILATDGRSNSGPAAGPIAEKLKNSGLKFEIFGIAVGRDADRQTIDQIVSKPTVSHAFNVSGFDALQSIVGALKTRSCVSIGSVSPSQGPSTGGTAVLVSGSGFENTAKLSCRFGQTVVPAHFGTDSQVACVTPPGQGSVAVEISLNGVDFTSSKDVSFQYTCPSADCGGHGVCISSSGDCLCNTGWTGPNCESPAGAAPSPAPAPSPPSSSCGDPANPCSGHGGCVDHQCHCKPGWSGPVCATSACPGTPPCNGNGECTNTGCQCDGTHHGPACQFENVLCCQYCQPVDRNHPNGPFKPSSWLAECYKSACPGRFPDVLVKSWVVAGEDLDNCIFNRNPVTNHPCIQDYGFCK